MTTVALLYGTALAFLFAIGAWFDRPKKDKQ